ncbi:MAG: hypothetical protein Fur0024_2920 [Patescibacteria group bacterium]
MEFIKGKTTDEQTFRRLKQDFNMALQSILKEPTKGFTDDFMATFYDTSTNTKNERKDFIVRSGRLVYVDKIDEGIIDWIDEKKIFQLVADRNDGTKILNLFQHCKDLYKTVRIIQQK